MADGEDKDQRTEAPTEKKLRDAAKKGQIAFAPEVRHAAMYGGAYLALAMLAGTSAAALARVLAGVLGSAGDWSFAGNAQPYLLTLAWEVMAAVAPVFGALVLAAIAGAAVQGRFLVSWERVRPKWSKLSPLSGVKRIFQPMEFLKTFGKFSIATLIVVGLLWPAYPMLERTMTVEPGEALAIAMQLTLRLLGAVLLLIAVVAAADYAQQRLSFMRQMRMTRQEVKDENKDAEGSPEIKARVRQIQRDRARRRMMQAVPSATVIITNPTHYAVALHYDDAIGSAPRVVAKGVDALALRIRDVAKGAGVPIVENVPLARALYAQVDLDRAIPAEHYMAVAEVISFVLRLRRKAVV